MFHSDKTSPSRFDEGPFGSLATLKRLPFRTSVHTEAHTEHVRYVELLHRQVLDTEFVLLVDIDIQRDVWGR